jgi:hypothetical protein
MDFVPNPPTDDTFDGTSGDDTFHLGPGTGHDTVIDNPIAGGTDVLQVDGGLTASNLAVMGIDEQYLGLGRFGLRIIDLATGDSMELQDQLTDTTGAKVETLRFGSSGGTVDLTAGLDMRGTSPDSPTPGYSGNDTFFGSLLGDTYHVGAGVGQDFVVERGTTAGVTDILQVDGGLTASNLAVMGVDEQYLGLGRFGLRITDMATAESL